MPKGKPTKIMSFRIDEELFDQVEEKLEQEGIDQRADLLAGINIPVLTQWVNGEIRLPLQKTENSC